MVEIMHPVPPAQAELGSDHPPEGREPPAGSLERSVRIDQTRPTGTKTWVAVQDLDQTLQRSRRDPGVRVQQQDIGA